MATKKNHDIIADLNDYLIDIDRRELWLHGQDDENSVDYKTAVMFEKNIRLLDSINNKPILIHMHLEGGSWEDGLGIYDAIKSAQSQITILVYAYASSMSGIILQAANKRIMHQNSFFMLHTGTFGLESHDVNNFKSNITKMLADLETMVDIYYERCKDGEKFKGMTAAKVKKILKDKMDEKGEWILPSIEAVEFGFCDAVFGDEGYETIESLKVEH